jgi:lipid-binding SYLF domain-containing protein
LHAEDGFYTTNKSQHPTPSPGDAKSPGPSGESKVLVKIPTSALANAKGLAIFTTFRTGLHISGAGGSGVVVARLPDGSWSPPAGFLVHTLGAGFMIGLDIYDCVCVLNTQAAVDAFARRARVSLGGELAVVAGPVGVGGSLEASLGRSTPGPKAQQGGGNGTPGVNATATTKSGGCENKPVWSYMKSRGFYAGIQADGTVIIPRPPANAAFYGERDISVEKILKGQVNPNLAKEGSAKDKDLVMWPEGGRQLAEVLKAVEGKGADAKVMQKLGDGPTPGDLAPPPDGGHGHGAAGVGGRGLNDGVKYA